MRLLTLSPLGPSSPITPLWPRSPWNALHHIMWATFAAKVKKHLYCGTNLQLPPQHHGDLDLHQDPELPARKQYPQLKTCLKNKHCKGNSSWIFMNLNIIETLTSSPLWPIIPMAPRIPWGPWNTTNRCLHEQKKRHRKLQICVL